MASSYAEKLDMIATAGCRRAFVMPIRYTNVTSRDVFIKNVAALLHLWNYRIKNCLVVSKLCEVPDQGQLCP